MNKVAKLLVMTMAVSAATAAVADGDRERGKCRHDDMIVAQQVIKTSGITADKAIDIAKKAYSGTVYQFGIDDDNNQLIYSVDLADAAKGEIYEVEVDASNGNIIKESIKRNPNSRKSTKVFAAVEAIQKAGFTVKDAIAKVNPNNDLLVDEVDYDDKLGVSYFEVEAFGASGKQKFLVDINQKSVIPGYKTKGMRHHER